MPEQENACTSATDDVSALIASLYSDHDTLLKTYGNTLEDGQHKPLDLLNDFLHRYLKRGITGVHVLP